MVGVGVVMVEMGAVVLEVGVVMVEMGGIMVVGLAVETVVVRVQDSNSQGWQAVTAGEGPLAASSATKEYSTSTPASDN